MKKVLVFVLLLIAMVSIATEEINLMQDTCIGRIGDYWNTVNYNINIDVDNSDKLIFYINDGLNTFAFETKQNSLNELIAKFEEWDSIATKENIEVTAREIPINIYSKQKWIRYFNDDWYTSYGSVTLAFSRSNESMLLLVTKQTASNNEYINCKFNIVFFSENIKKIKKNISAKKIKEALQKYEDAEQKENLLQ